MLLSLWPKARSGLVFVNRIAGGAIPKEVHVRHRKGAAPGACSTAGRRVIRCLGLKATLLDGSSHEKDSSASLSRSRRGRRSRSACATRGRILLEPLMRVVVTAPGDYLGGIIGDLQRRRGQILSATPLGRVHEIVAEAPLAEMFNYVSALRSLSQGRASFTMTLRALRSLAESIVGQGEQTTLGPEGGGMDGESRLIPLLLG